MELDVFEATVLRLRVVLMRVMMLSDEVETLQEAIRLLKAAGTAAVRLGKVMKLRHELREAEREAAWAEELIERSAEAESESG